MDRRRAAWRPSPPRRLRALVRARPPSAPFRRGRATETASPRRRAVGGLGKWPLGVSATTERGSRKSETPSCPSPRTSLGFGWRRLPWTAHRGTSGAPCSRASPAASLPPGVSSTSASRRGLSPSTSPRRGLLGAVTPTSPSASAVGVVAPVPSGACSMHVAVDHSLLGWTAWRSFMLEAQPSACVLGPSAIGPIVVLSSAPSVASVGPAIDVCAAAAGLPPSRGPRESRTAGLFVPRVAAALASAAPEDAWADDGDQAEAKDCQTLLDLFAPGLVAAAASSAASPASRRAAGEAPMLSVGRSVAARPRRVRLDRPRREHPPATRSPCKATRCDTEGFLRRTQVTLGAPSPASEGSSRTS